MDEKKQFDDEWKRKRKLANARMQEYRKRKRGEAEHRRSMAEKRRSMTQDEPNYKIAKSQITETNTRRQRDLAKEASKRYRERKRIDAIQSVNHVVHDSLIPGPPYSNSPSAVHDSQITETSTNMDDPLRIGADTENVNRVPENRARLSRGQVQIQKKKNVEHQRALARERSRKYRARKRINARPSDHLVQNSQIAETSMNVDSPLVICDVRGNVNHITENRVGLSRGQTFVTQENQPIDGTTVHTTLRISLSKLLPLSIDVAHQYRSLFKYVRAIIIDEVSMIGPELLKQIDLRLKQITGNFESPFGNLDVKLISDVRQLPSVRATPIFKQMERRMTEPTVCHGSKFYELTEVMRLANSMFSNALTKIGNGEKLNTDELSLIESRFVSKESADTACPHGIRLFLSNSDVQKYNNLILDTAADKVTSVAKDIYTGCHSSRQQALLKQKLHKMSTTDTGGLPYEITFVVDKHYMLTTNVNLSDGLASGAIGKLCHIDYDHNGEINRVWLVFPNSDKIGSKIRSKVTGHMTAHNIPRNAVPIFGKSCTVPLNDNKTINAKRNHFPVVPAFAITIHESQGATLDEIVYEYERTHSQQLVYDALSRVTGIEGLYIVTENNNPTFFHGRRECMPVSDLQNECNRLSFNKLRTVNDMLTNFISNRKEMSIYSSNCQSLRAHALDLDDSITQRSTISLLSENWIKSEEDMDVPNLQCVAKFKRPDCRAAGVAILQNNRDTTSIVSSEMDVTFGNSQSYGFNKSSIGEISVAKCEAANGQVIVTVAMYISPNQNIDTIIQFVHENLLIYTEAGSALLHRNLHELPMVLSGHFNVDFSTDKSKPLIDFFKSTLDLSMSNDPSESTTNYGKTIDAVFSRYLNRS